MPSPTATTEPAAAHSTAHPGTPKLTFTSLGRGHYVARNGHVQFKVEPCGFTKKGGNIYAAEARHKRRTIAVRSDFPTLEAAKLWLRSINATLPATGAAR